MSDLTDFGFGVANTAVGTGMGLLLQGQQDRRQLAQQGKLQHLQIQGQKEMTDYQYMKQLQMWKDTNYSAQMSQLKAAGLNPGLIYGMSGGGATTTGSGGGTVTGAHAPVGGGEAIAGAGMAMQLGLLKAQKENIEADTRNKEADIPVKGATVPKLQAETDSIRQGITNAKITESILKWEDNIKRIDSNVAEQTQGDRMGQIVSMAEAAASTAEMIERDNQIAEATKQAKINQIKAESYGVVLRNELTQAQTGKTNAEVSKIAADIANTIVNMGVEWAKLGMEGQKVMLQKRLVEFNTSQSQRTYDNILRGLDRVTTIIKPGTTINQGPRETIINNQY